MTDQDSESIERYKAAVRRFRDQKVIDTFRLHGLGIADMDRAELVGAICFLLNNAPTVVRDKSI